MAIYHWQMQGISRSTGRSMVACAAYRAAERMVDERTAEIYDFGRKGGVIYSEVLLPEGQTVDRETLWNAVENAEARKDAKVGREIILALPAEMTDIERNALVRCYGMELVNRTGWAVDIAVHAPGRGGDSRNHHAHLLCSTRQVSLGEDGSLQIGAKTREWDVMQTGKHLVTQERQAWEQLLNRELERYGYEQRVDSRSHEARGTGLEPQIHLGPMVTAMERRGIQTEVGDLYREIARNNEQVIELAKVRAEKEQAMVWQEQLKTYETLPLKELQQELYELRPHTKEELLQQIPEVNDYAKQLDTIQREESQLKKDIGDAEWLVRRQMSELSNWREENKVHSWLHEMGMMRNDDVLKSVNELERLQELVENRKEALEQAGERRIELSHSLDTVKTQAMEQIEQIREKEVSHYREVQALYEQRREQEREQERALGKEQYRGMER